jgi:hypothetical protein
MPGGGYEPSDPRWKEVRAKDLVDQAWEWKMPINFYGRVVDENGQPVSAAKVQFSWTDLTPAGNSTAITTSDSEGAFSLRGTAGRVLQVDVSKEGYYKPKEERLKSFDYAAFWSGNYHQPNPGNPVLFHLRKKGAGEPISSGHLFTDIPTDGTAVRFDLLNSGRVSPTGQLEIVAVTNTEKYPPRIFDWRASISVPSGGLVEHNVEFPFDAPQDGYQPRIDFSMPASAPNWKRGIDKSYFIQFGSPPRYGRIQVSIDGASPKIALDFWVNPSGSRNLEPDDVQQVSAR